MFYDVFQKRSSWCRVLVSGAKIAEPPTLVNSNNAEIFKKHTAHDPAGRKSLFFCNASKKHSPLLQLKTLAFAGLPYRNTAVTHKKNITIHRPDGQ